MEKIKKEYIRHSDMLHRFANGVTELKSSTGTITIKDDKLYYNNTIMAAIYSRRKKIVFINSNFDITGAFGNGISSWDISRAFSDDWTIVNYNMRHTVYSSINKDNVYCKSTDPAKSKVDTFNRIIVEYFDKIIQAKEGIDRVVYGNGMVLYRTIDGIKNIQEEYQRIKQDLNIPDKLLNIKIKQHQIYITHHQGWTNVSYVKYLNDFKYKEYLIDYKLTDEEIHIVNMKNWIHKYIYKTYRGFTMTKLQKQELYNDVEKRETIEDEKIETDRINAENRSEKIKEEQKKKVDDWLDGKIFNALWSLDKIYLRFRSNDLETIETSHNANVPTRHAKLLYNIFKKCIKDDKAFKANGSTIKVGHYKVEFITKTDDGRWYLKAGCHYIYEEQINQFVTANNLDW